MEENVIILVKWCDELSGESLSSLDGYDMLGLRNVTQKYLEVWQEFKMINLCKVEKGGPGSGWATGKK